MGLDISYIERIRACIEAWCANSKHHISRARCLLSRRWTIRLQSYQEKKAEACKIVPAMPACNQDSSTWPPPSQQIARFACNAPTCWIWHTVKDVGQLNNPGYYHKFGLAQPYFRDSPPIFSKSGRLFSCMIVSLPAVSHFFARCSHSLDPTSPSSQPRLHLQRPHHQQNSSFLCMFAIMGNYSVQYLLPFWW